MYLSSIAVARNCGWNADLLFSRTIFKSPWMLVLEKLYFCSDMEVYVKGEFSLTKLSTRKTTLLLVTNIWTCAFSLYLELYFLMTPICHRCSCDCLVLPLRNKRFACAAVNAELLQRTNLTFFFFVTVMQKTVVMVVPKYCHFCLQSRIPSSVQHFLYSLPCNITFVPNPLPNVEGMDSCLCIHCCC